MKGNRTAEVMRLDAMACCVRLTGSGARAEKCRMAEAGRLDRSIVANHIVDEGSLKETKLGGCSLRNMTLVCFENSDFSYTIRELLAYSRARGTLL